MATNEEMDVLNWFLWNHPDLFPGVTAISGTQQEDWADTDAWLMRNGEKQISLGIRRHADELWDRYFTLRIRRGDVDVERFEFAKLVNGGGPQFYLQAWGYLPINLTEFVFISVKRMRAAGCFVPANQKKFWDENYYKMSDTRWATMTVTALHDIPDCVVLSDVHNRGSFHDDMLDKASFKTERVRFKLHPKGKAE